MINFTGQFFSIEESDLAVCCFEPPFPQEQKTRTKGMVNKKSFFIISRINFF
jgi:hypothetical protein